MKIDKVVQSHEQVDGAKAAKQAEREAKMVKREAEWNEKVIRAGIILTVIYNGDKMLSLYVADQRQAVDLRNQIREVNGFTASVQIVKTL